MQRKRFSNTSHWWRYLPLVAAGLVVTACGQDMTPPDKQQDVPPAFDHLSVGANEYNLIDPNDPAACTTAATCLVEINDGYWQFPYPFQVGTGNLNPFWDTHETGTSECFNTDYDQPGSGLVLDCARSSWTNPLPLNEVPFFFFDPPGADPPVLVREIVIDLNEPNDSPETAQVSIDWFRVYLCEADAGPPVVNPALFSSTAQVVANCDKVYSIEVGGINTGTQGTGLAWDASTQGSGNSLDYRVLIPESFFEAANQAGVDSCPYDPAGPACGLYVIVWAQLGGKGAAWITSGGFEEMSTVLRPVPARKSGVKFHDLDADGVKDAGEPGLPGWTIYVDMDGDGVLDAGEPNDVTDATGAYEINAIPEGTWRVKEVAQAGWTCSYPNPCYHEEEFADGDVLTGNDFGNYTTASKTGMKFNDLDADGVKDAGEPGLAGWTIYVDYDDDGVADAGEPSAVTIAGGTYSITGITPGTWKVKEVAQAGWTCSFPAVAPNCFHQETFQSGGSYPNNDFGNWTTASKSGMKFNDLLGDGVKDAGDPGLSGWVIFVDYDNDGILDAGEPNATTAAGGTYSITGITPGTYRVREVLQAGWTCTYPATTDAFGCYHEETFQSNGSYPNNDFGNFFPPTADTQTAYARGHGGATCFPDLNPPIANNWGWGITVLRNDLPEQYEIWAGAAQCITDNGTLVGTLTVSIVGGKIRFSYDLLPGYTLDAIHVYVSTTGFPPSVSPGQFPYKSNPGTNDAFIDTINDPLGGTIYFIAHAVVSGF